MTSTNGISNGHDLKKQNLTPEELQLEIARTKSAITEDLRLLSERFDPQHLREGARVVMRDVREEAHLLIQEAKEATIGAVIGAKDRAFESVKESVQEKVSQLGKGARMVSDQARQLGDRALENGNQALRYVGQNPLMFSLIGVGAGWLLVALRNLRRSRHRRYALPAQTTRASDTVRHADHDAVRSMATQSTRAVDRARAEARGALAPQRGQPARAALQRGARSARTAASDGKLGVIALTVAAGLGIGLLLPQVSGRRSVWRDARLSAE